MSKRLYFTGAALAIASLALGACGALSPTGAASTAAEARTLTVTGSAQVALTPDIAYIQVGVHTEGETVGEAVNTNNSQVESVKTALRNMGVEDKDLQTSNFSIYQTDKWSPDGTTYGRVYSVDNTVYVTVRNLSNMGALLQAAVEAGANNIYGIQFDVADKQAALEQGRGLAVTDAQRQAAQLAAAAGVDLGEIRSITHYSGAYATPFYGYGGYGGGGGEAVSISAGELMLQVEVSVVYDITP
ncbi:MAG: SIMPL domain-containing protein [Chloroflexi bacterium]|nr:SIMPL domain-containing protein [Chloroflexota bacterium]